MQISWQNSYLDLGGVEIASRECSTEFGGSFDRPRITLPIAENNLSARTGFACIKGCNSWQLFT